jgi:hypothetical protein
VAGFCEHGNEPSGSRFDDAVPTADVIQRREGKILLGLEEVLVADFTAASRQLFCRLRNTSKERIWIITDNCYFDTTPAGNYRAL